MILSGETAVLGEKPVPVPLCPPYDPKRSGLEKTWVFEIKLRTRIHTESNLRISVSLGTFSFIRISCLVLIVVDSCALSLRTDDSLPGFDTMWNNG